MGPRAGSRPGARRRGPARRHAAARPRHLVAGAGARARPLPGRVADRPGVARPTATISTVTCCRCRRSGSRAGCSAACRARGAMPVDYERAGGPSVTRLEAWLTRWLPRPLATLVEDLAELMRAATMPRVPKHLLHRRMAPLLAAVLGMQMRRASIPALAGWSTASGSTPIGCCSGTCTGSDRWTGDSTVAVARPRRPPADREHRLVGVRAAAAAPGGAAAPVLAGRRGAARGRPGPARDRAARQTSQPAAMH